MSQEIVYTSAPQGLKPGSRGFCTVIATQGMARNLAERLESLSGYRHAFAVHDEHAHLNPVNYSHLKVTVGGQEYSVVSRIGDAGQDYTGRTNKLAHHVALTHTERPPAGPAYQLQQPGFCIEEWDSQTRYTELNCHRLSSDHPPLTQCTTWSRWCDAGWAGVLAQSALEAGNQTQTIIYPVEAGSSTLSLVAEALQLLPEKQRWEVTFSTYFTKLPAGVDCQWRFVLDGSPEAEAARRNPRIKLIDLCTDLGTAPEGPLVAAARTGQINRQKNSASPKAIHVAPPIPSHEIVQQDSTEENSDFPEPASPVPHPVMKTRRASGPPPLEKHFQKPKKSRKLLIGSSVVLLFLLIAGTGYLLMPGQNEHEQVVQTPKPSTEMKQKIILEKMEKDKKEASVKKVKRLAPVEKPKQPASPPQTEMVTKSEPKQVKIEPKKKPFEDVRKIHQGVLQLPSLNKNIGADNKSELTKIYVDDVNDCELSIVGSEKVLGDGSLFILEPISGKKGQWKVIKQAGKGLGKNAVGIFRLKNNSFMFDWEKSPPSLSQSLSFCLLKMTVSDDTVLCRLSEPDIENHSISIDFKSSVPKKEKIPISISSLPPAEHLRLKVYLNGIPKNGLKGFSKFHNANDSVLKLDPKMKSVKTIIFNPMTEVREPFFDLNISFSNITDFYGVELQAEAHEKYLEKDEKNTFKSKLVSRKNIEDRIKECKNEIEKHNKVIEKQTIILTQLNPQLDEICRKTKPTKVDPMFPKQPQANATMQDKYVYLQQAIQFFQMKNIKVNYEALELAHNIKVSNSTIEDSNNKIEFARKNEKWCNKMLELFNQLEKNVSIDYELFIEIEGEKVVIIKTTLGSKKH